MTHDTAAFRNQTVYHTLRSRICLLDYPPNSRLSEESLAAEFGMSRTPLRRVLARLEDEGLVQSQHGVGTLVTDVDIAEMRHVYELRMELAQLVGTLSPAPIHTQPEPRLPSSNRAPMICAKPPMPAHLPS